MNSTPPNAQLTDQAAGIGPDELEVIGTLARTYDAQRLRLLERRRPSQWVSPASPIRALTETEPAVVQDGSAVSASIVDAVVKSAELARAPIALPLPDDPQGLDDLVAAEAGWWDALLGDVERRTGLAPRSIRLTLHSDTPEGVRAVFTDRVAP